jgi:hypothetical protein
VKDIAPALLEFVSRRDIKETSVAAAMENRSWIRQITGGITVPAIMEYLRLWDILTTITLGEGEDKLIWRWTADGTYSSKLAYRALFTAANPVYGCPMIWGTWAPLRVKIFLWLAIRRRHWTADRRR